MLEAKVAQQEGLIESLTKDNDRLRLELETRLGGDVLKKHMDSEP